jgi:hypothetical protein
MEKMQPADEAFRGRVKLITLYCNIAQVQSGLLPQLLSYFDLRRLLTIRDEEVSTRGDDYLSQVLVERLRPLCHTPGDMLDPTASLAALFEVGPVPKSYQERALMIWDLRNSVALAGCIIGCRFMQDATLGTQRFSEEYITTKKLPPDLTQMLFVDVVCSKRQPAATLGVMTFFKIAARTRRDRMVGVSAIAIHKRALSLFTGLGFASHEYREEGQTRWLCWLHTADLKMETVASRLNFEGSEDVFKICYRRGLTPKTTESVIARCSTS